MAEVNSKNNQTKNTKPSSSNPKVTQPKPPNKNINETSKPEEKITSMTIGVIPYTDFNNRISGANFLPGVTESRLSKLAMIEIVMIPMEIKFQPQSFILYSLTPAEGSYAPPRLTIYSNIDEISLSEGYGTSMKSSLFENFERRLEIIGQLNQIGILSDVQNTVKEGVRSSENKSTIVSKIADLGSKAAENIMTLFSGLFNDLSIADSIEVLKPYIIEGAKVYLGGSRIIWPKIWADSSASLSYSIPIYLFCNDTSNDDLYKKSIVEPLKALLQYTLPRSTGGSTYQWPWFTYVEAPGLFILPEAVVTDIQIEKHDIGYNNRPATVKVVLTVTTIREAMPQSGTDPKDIPTVALNLNSYIENLSKDKNSKISLVESTGIPMSQEVTKLGGGSRTSNSNTIPNRTISTKDILRLTNGSLPNNPVLAVRLIKDAKLAGYNNPTDFIKAINEKSKAIGTPPHILWQVMAQESSFNNTAVSSAGAYGMGQFMPTTWAAVGGSKTDDPYLQAIYTAKFLKQEHDKSGDWIIAVNNYQGYSGSTPQGYTIYVAQTIQDMKNNRPI